MFAFVTRETHDCPSEKSFIVILVAEIPCGCCVELEVPQRCVCRIESEVAHANPTIESF
jgi:hypothetical protein